MKVKSIGFPRIISEKGERRDFLPTLFEYLSKYKDTQIYLERNYGGNMGFSHDNYLSKNPNIKFVSHDETYEQDLIIVLKAPTEDEIRVMKNGSILVSMLHYDTRPHRNKLLIKQGVKCFSMDSMTDNNNNRIVVNYYGTSRPGTKIAFYELRNRMKDFYSKTRKPIRVTIIGMGGVGLNCARAFEEFSDKEFLKSDIPGVTVTMLPRSITKDIELLEEIMKDTDILVEASKRTDTSKVIIPNSLISSLPEHAIILDLTADPYDESISPIQVKGIEGIPTGNLEKLVIETDDELYDSIPKHLDSTHRRVVISCNAWPGVEPIDSMSIYENQLKGFIDILLKKDPFSLDINSEDLYEGSLVRASLDFFINDTIGI